MSDRYQRLEADDVYRASVIASQTEYSVIELVENTVEQRRGGD